MKKNEELLQRFLDNDLNDNEMKKLFIELSTNDVLRKQFRTMQTFRIELQSIPSQNVPVALDMKIKSLSSSSELRLLPNKSLLRRVVEREFKFSIPAFAATILLLLVGSYVAATNVFVRKAVTEYIYVIEIEPITIQSSYIQ
jgi:hypothetical protein